MKGPMVDMEMSSRGLGCEKDGTMVIGSSPAKNSLHACLLMSAKEGPVVDDVVVMFRTIAI